MSARVLFIAVWMLAGAAEIPSPTPPAKPEWKVEFHDRLDSTALGLACFRKGEHELRCVDLKWFLDARDQERTAAEQLEKREERQHREWKCTDMQGRSGAEDDTFTRCDRDTFRL